MSMQISKDSKELVVNFVFTESEHNQLYDLLSNIFVNPYYEYKNFNKEIQTLINNLAIPSSFIDFCNAQKEENYNEQPFVFIKNCPIDKTLPILDFEETSVSYAELKSQLKLKETFVTEGFLALYAALLKTPVISYASFQGNWFRNPPPSFRKKSQLSDNSGWLPIHKEMVDHIVSPTYVNLLTMQSCSDNQVYTTFMKNKDVLQLLDEDIKAELRKKQFCTLYSRYAQCRSENECYAILSGDINLRYFENHTKGICEKAQLAVKQLNKTLHLVKKQVLMMPGDFISIYNQAGLHGREVHQIVDEEQLKSRWLIKTCNVDSLEDYTQYFVKGQYGVIDDETDVWNTILKPFKAESKLP